jgi:predicted metal-binding protein
MKKVNPTWNERVVLVCSLCRPEGAPKPSCGHHGGEELRTWLKEQLLERGQWGTVRVVTVSCLDFCPKDGITVSIQGAAGEPETFIVEGLSDRDALLGRITDQLADYPKV